MAARFATDALSHLCNTYIERIMRAGGCPVVIK